VPPSAWLITKIINLTLHGIVLEPFFFAAVGVGDGQKRK
jgi:hypothetical protein